MELLQSSTARTWGPNKPKYASEVERKAARVKATLKCRAKKKNEYNTYMREYHQESYRTLRDEVLEKLGNKCTKCGFDKDWRALQIDHINGKGRKERRKIGWRIFFMKILNGDTNYQLLCANCNYVKRYTNNEVHFVDQRLKEE